MNHPCSEAVEQDVGLLCSCLIHHNLTNPGKGRKTSRFLKTGMVSWGLPYGTCLEAPNGRDDLTRQERGP